MLRVEKTVFISYRRTNAPWALAVYQNLKQHGYDVFFDFQGLASGDFETVLLANIRSRAHFVVLLTPSALERCNEPGDWLRREIETALDSKRNIVPLMLEGFSFDSPMVGTQLTGKLAALKQYNALPVPVEYFEAAMNTVRQEYLDVPLDAVLHPTSPSAGKLTESQQVAASAAQEVDKKELTAQGWFEQGFVSTKTEERISAYTEAIRMNPDFAEAYNNRGNARQAVRDLGGAIEDYTEAIRISPTYSEPYNNRGTVRYTREEYLASLQDYDEALRLKPDNAQALYNRGRERRVNGDPEGAKEDYADGLRLNPDHAWASEARDWLIRT